MKRWLPFLGMIAAILAAASNMVVMKIAMTNGINRYIILFYCNLLSTLILSPSPFIYFRSGSRPPITFPLIRGIFLLSLIGFLAATFGYSGIDYSSPMLGSAMLNLIPAFTFILAIISRTEKMEWRSSSSQAKLLGTMTCLAGAFIVTFYKGPPILSSISPSSLPVTPPSEVLGSAGADWILGGFFLAGEALMISLYYIVQAFILRYFPAVMAIMFCTQFLATVFVGLFSLVVVREAKSWELKFNSGLTAVVYTAVVGSVIRLGLIAWCVKERGPVYVSMFKPLGFIFTALMGFLFLGEVLRLGSFIGAAVIVVGFYWVMWGKSKEDEKETSSSSCTNTPLLQSETP